MGPEHRRVLVGLIWVKPRWLRLSKPTGSHFGVGEFATHFSLFWSGLACSLGVRGFDPCPGMNMRTTESFWAWHALARRWNQCHPSCNDPSIVAGLWCGQIAPEPLDIYLNRSFLGASQSVGVTSEMRSECNDSKGPLG